MNLFWLLLLLPLLATGNGKVHLNVATLEVSTEELSNESNSGAKIYSTGADNNPISIQQSVAAEEDDGEEFFLGTALFHGPRRECFTLEDIALLRARQGLEWLVPKTYPKYMANDSMAYRLVRYWNVVNEIVHHMSDKYTERLMKAAFYDTLGAYLRYYLVPLAQVSFYAGRVSLPTVEHLVDIKRQCHQVLRTNGNAWRMPAIINITEQMKNLSMDPFVLSSDDSNICDQLDLSQVSDQRQMILLLPNLEPLDANGYLTNIYLPFRENRVYNLRASSSASELKRFLNTIAACQSYLKMNPTNYNHKLLDWIKEFVPHHLADEQFYPGLSGILQIQDNLVKIVEREDNDRDNSGKQGRSISLWKETADQQSLYTDERLYIAASVVLVIVFIMVVCGLYCGRRCAEKKSKGKSPMGPEDVELGEVFTMAKPKRVKREKKLKIETPRSPLKITSDRRYYGHQARSLSSEDCSTSTLGFQLKQKIMPFRFEIPVEKVRKSYKYTPLSSQTTETTQYQEKKKSGRGK
ncbi:hypothetical protein KR032_003297 [Drosophila birchii]|nr:hypothetical protein KR032_003297 [Drosophila birchii]